jgi:excisionase family DNA binding protein
MAEDRMLTVDQVAERLQLGPETIRRWLRAGKLRGVRLGGTKAGYRVPEVARLLSTETPPPPD